MPGVHWPPEFPPSVIIGVVAASCRDVVDEGCDWTCVVDVGDECTVVVGAAVVDCTVVVGAVGADCVVAVGVALIDCDAVVGVAVDDCTDVVGAVVVDCAELVCAAAIVWNFAFSVCGGIFAGVGLAVVARGEPNFHESLLDSWTVAFFSAAGWAIFGGGPGFKPRSQAESDS